jgi:hypothetical protein
MRVVLESAVMVHDHGSWSAFSAGDLAGAGAGLEVSSDPAGSRMEVWRHRCITRVWPGDLADLRRRGGIQADG